MRFSVPASSLGVIPGRFPFAGDDMRVNGMTRYTEQCSGDDSSPSSPGEGLAPLDDTDRNVPRFRPCGRLVVLRAANQNQLIAGGNHTIIPSADCRRYSGGTMIWVIPFTPTGYTSNVAGGRLPPLRVRPLWQRLVETAQYSVRGVKSQGRGAPGFWCYSAFASAMILAWLALGTSS